MCQYVPHKTAPSFRGPHESTNANAVFSMVHVCAQHTYRPATMKSTACAAIGHSYAMYAMQPENYNADCADIRSMLHISKQTSQSL